ncbi:MAG TPA: SCO family protein [Bacteroidia bacterium]|nr:SCO family protein [Bacteroidia bacterium]
MKLKAVLKPLALCAGLLLSNCGEKPRNEFLLPVMGPKTLEGKDTVYHHIGTFRFTNQFGKPLTNHDISGKIVVSNFFFASCQSICPEMSSNLKQVQAAFDLQDSVLILSHTVNPMNDTVEVLRQYAELYGAKAGKWHFLTGKKDDIYALAKNDYLVNALEDDGSPGGFLHSELFLLLDTKGRIRGMYDGTSKADVQKLIGDIHLLLREQN